MSEATTPPRALRWLGWGLCLLAGLAGWVYGYEVGQRVSGLLLGFVMGLNAAVIASVLTSAIVDRVLRLVSPRAQAS